MRACVVLIGLSGCCGKGAPTWLPLDTLYLGGGSASLDLQAFVLDDEGVEAFEARGDEQVIVEVRGDVLTVTAQPDWDGQTTVRLVAVDGCDNRAGTDLVVDSGSPPTTPSGGGDCVTRITYTPFGDPDAVAIAGPFNDWSTDGDRLTDEGGLWSIDLELPPGAYPYKLVELEAAAFGDTATWLCDPSAPLIQCDPGYTWDQRCEPGASACNSLLVVPPCALPSLEVEALGVDRSSGTLHVEVVATPGSGGDVSVAATLDGAPAQGTWDGQRFVVDAALAPGRHTLRVDASDAAGNAAEQVYVPVWIDGTDVTDGVMYFAFVDRVRNGEPGNDGPTGATATGGDYEGGDLQGLIEMLPYLDDLGVTILWVSNLLDNAEGAWDGDCDLTYAGYHAYWPDSPDGYEEHFGDGALVDVLVDEAHARGMRVVMDFVANHVHEDHPYYADHPEWFTPYDGCKDSVNGQLGFDRIPETCWFAPYLPDIDYSQPEPLVRMVDDAMAFAIRHELDGFRVDAVKHMSHALAWNLASEIDRRIEHPEAGGDELFWTVGETFDGHARIAEYVGPDQLSGQFDFPLYYAIRDAFVYGTTEVESVLWAWDTSQGWFGDAPMSTFLGNHDVLRFVSDATTGWQDPCDGTNIRVASPPTDPWPYERLKLAWTFLFTMPGTPLVYYGDELGLPGNPDPDNRQPLWWHTGGDLDGVETVEDLAAKVGADQASVLRHVRALAHARAEHEALRKGGWVEWWKEWDLVAYARSSGGSHALVVLNRSGTPRDLTNGLAFAGLPQGTYEDVLTGAAVGSVGDQLTAHVEANASAVLVWRP